MLRQKPADPDMNYVPPLSPLRRARPGIHSVSDAVAMQPNQYPPRMALPRGGGLWPSDVATHRGLGILLARPDLT
jgi:hypothetical protein